LRGVVGTKAPSKDSTRTGLTSFVKQDFDDAETLVSGFDQDAEMPVGFWR
jgi:hypothetical protein